MQKTNKQKIRLLGSNKIYRGNISVRIDRFQLDKKMIKKEIIEHLPSVGIIPVRDDHNIIFVVQYRHATGKTMLEIPAGKIENDETPMQAAFREMAEEIGYTGNLAPLSHWYLAPGYRYRNDADIHCNKFEKTENKRRARCRRKYHY